MSTGSVHARSRAGNRRRLLAIALLLLASLSTFSLASRARSAQPAPGELDPFNRFTVAAQQPDGKVVAAGTTQTCAEPPPACAKAIVVARYESNGRLDPSFDGNGVLRTSAIPLENWNAGPTAVRIDAEGRIVLGIAGGEAAGGVLRLLPNGDLDPGFGQGGVLPVSAGRVWNVVAAPSGSLFVSLRERGIARLTPDGALDPTWGEGGIAPRVMWGSEMRVQPDGKLLIAAESGVTRLLADGSPDPSFSGDGVTDPIPVADPIHPEAHLDFRTLALQPDGRIVAAAVSFGGSKSAPRVTLLRFRADGALDPDFGGGDGQAAGTSSCATLIVVQDDGTLVTAGFNNLYMQGALCIERRASDGSLLAGSKNWLFAGEVSATVTVLDIRPDGTVVTGGGGGFPVADDGSVGVIARYSSGGSLDRQFGLGFLPEITCRGRTATGLFPTEGSDVLIGIPFGKNRIEGRGGRDLICGLAGRDTIRGGRGPDRIFAGPGRDRVWGGDGNDVLRGGPGRDRLTGGAGRDRIRN